MGVRNIKAVEKKDWQARLRKHKWIVALAFFFLMFVGVATALYMRPDPKMARVSELQEQMITKAKKTMTAWTKGQTNSTQQIQQMKEGMKLRDQYNEAKSKLTPEQRERHDTQARQQWKSLMKGFMQHFEKQLDDYFAMPKSQQIAFLDQKIKEFDARRKLWQSMRKGKGKSGSGVGGKNRDPKSREARSKMFLDMTTPEFRAKVTKFRDDMNARRKDLGLPIGNRRGPF